MVRIGGGWNTLENYLARCDPCRCQKNSASAAFFSTSIASTIPTTTFSSRTTSNFPATSTKSTTPTTSSTSTSPSTSATPNTTFTSGQSAISDNEAVSPHQRQVVGSDRLNSSCSDLLSPSSSSSSKVTTTTVTTSGRQQPIPRRLSDLSLTSQALPVSNANYRSEYRRSPRTTIHYDDIMTGEVAAAASLSHGTEPISHATSSCCDDDSDVTAGDSVHLTSSSRIPDDHLTVLSSTLSPSLVAADTAVDTPCSCPQLPASDDPQHRSTDSRIRTPVCRPSCIPVPLRLATQSPSQSVTFLLGSAVNSPVNRHRRCDSGVDLNLSSPDFDNFDNAI